MPNGIFLVLNWVDQDLKQIFTESSIMPPSFDRDHVKIILYNILCAINYLQTANIIHRDLKPGNLLITDTCGIKICDFGLARSMPEGYDQLIGVSKQDLDHYNQEIACKKDSASSYHSESTLAGTISAVYSNGSNESNKKNERELVADILNFTRE